MPKFKTKTAAANQAASERSRQSNSAELLLLALIVVGGIVLRVWQPAHMAVEHFDEGVYASNLLCPFNDNAYPFRHLYAPPLLPALLEWSLILSGIAASSVMWVNVIAGCALVPSVWWVTRTWFGPLAGLTAAALAALSPLHIQYSRAALTDGLLCLWMLWGVYWAWRAILGGRPVAIFLAGLFAGLAWWTKYNGWLTLAISGAGLAAWIFAPLVIPDRIAAQFNGKTGRRRYRGDDAATADMGELPAVTQAIIRWALLSLIAIGGWSPVLVGLQDVGGYAAVAANHARYFIGMSGWVEGFSRQAANLSHYHSGLSLLAMALAAVAVAVVIARPMLPALSIPHERRSLAGWMLAAWFIGLLVAVPLYTPYPRLTLPWILASWIVAGIAVSFWIARFPLVGLLKSRASTRTGLAAVMLVAGFVLQGVSNRSSHITADRRGVQVIAGQILDRIASDGPSPAGNSEGVVVRVIGEPGLFFHLAVAATHQSGFSHGIAIVPVADYATDSGQNLRIYTVAGPHAPTFEDVAPEVRDDLTLFGEWDYHPSDLVLLDEMGPAALSDRQSLPSKPVRLFRAKR